MTVSPRTYVRQYEELTCQILTTSPIEELAAGRVGRDVRGCGGDPLNQDGDQYGQSDRDQEAAQGFDE